METVFVILIVCIRTDLADADGDAIPDGSLCVMVMMLQVIAMAMEFVTISIPVCDTIDFDLDGVPDACDVCPLDNPDDSDGDGICDSNDICPGSAT